MSTRDRIKKARDPERPTAQHYVTSIFSDFMELHGDRTFGDDPAMVTGIARLNGMPVTVIAQERGDTTEKRIKRNFGSSHPEGYRKALRQMRAAEKFRRPVISFIDTSGAFCSAEAEMRGQGEAIARCLLESSSLEVPMISIVIGEGGSGGALALGAGDELWMIRNSFYSVISPEGCASILYKDPSKIDEAAESLKILPENLMEFGVCSRIFDDLDGEAAMISEMRESLAIRIKELKSLTAEELLKRRYSKIRNIGRFKNAADT